MEALWIIIFIVFVLLRAFSKIPNLKEKMPKDWENTGIPPILRDMEFPWDEHPRRPGDVRKQPGQKQRPAAPKTPPVKEPGRPVKPEVVRDMQGAEVRQQDACREPHWFPPVDSRSVINGIIFTELLQPPRCKRPRHRKL